MLNAMHMAPRAIDSVAWMAVGTRHYCMHNRFHAAVAQCDDVNVRSNTQKLCCKECVLLLRTSAVISNRCRWYNQKCSAVVHAFNITAPMQTNRRETLDTKEEIWQ